MTTSKRFQNFQLCVEIFIIESTVMFWSSTARFVGSDQSLPQICPHHQTCQASNMPSQQYAKPATCQVSKAQVNKAQVPSQHCDHSRQVGSQSEPQSSHHSNTSNRVLRTYKQTISKWMISKCQAIRNNNGAVQQHFQPFGRTQGHCLQTVSIWHCARPNGTPF